MVRTLTLTIGATLLTLVVADLLLRFSVPLHSVLDLQTDENSKSRFIEAGSRRSPNPVADTTFDQQLGWRMTLGYLQLYEPSGGNADAGALFLLWG